MSLNNAVPMRASFLEVTVLPSPLHTSESPYLEQPVSLHSVQQPNMNSLVEYDGARQAMR
jgi:hypothetical protein